MSGDPPRYKLRFKDPDALQAAVAVETADTTIVPVINRKRGYISVSVASIPVERSQDPSAAIASADSRAAMERDVSLLAKEYGAEIVPDRQYAPECGGGALRALEGDIDGETGVDGLAFWHGSGSDEELARALDVANVPAAHEARSARGRGVLIAVVDTGIDATRARIPTPRRAGGITGDGDGDPWADGRGGHGTRSARIAAGEDGVAPEASVYSCRTKFFSGELTAIYDHLIDKVMPGLHQGRLVITNSFGWNSATAPELDPQDEFVAAIRDACAAGAAVVFSAGNYHKKVGGRAEDCAPTSIWSYKCLERVLTVAAGDDDLTAHDYSSRGPGQLWGEPGFARKPDVAAAVPAKWGTSAACPQVAGLAALLWSVDGSLALPQLQETFGPPLGPHHRGRTAWERGSSTAPQLCPGAGQAADRWSRRWWMTRAATPPRTAPRERRQRQVPSISRAARLEGHPSRRSGASLNGRRRAPSALPGRRSPAGTSQGREHAPCSACQKHIG